ncbi:MAG: hypothetical protein HC942_04155 [Microcoleus sp. SU_5_6]|nr:hypothetical protein [Microcoleus sp. SU_5_6]
MPVQARILCAGIGSFFSSSQKQTLPVEPRILCAGIGGLCLWNREFYSPETPQDF